MSKSVSVPVLKDFLVSGFMSSFRQLSHDETSDENVAQCKMLLRALAGSLHYSMEAHKEVYDCLIQTLEQLSNTVPLDQVKCRNATILRTVSS